jgi:hypothetical protein
VICAFGRRGPPRSAPKIVIDGDLSRRLADDHQMLAFVVRQWSIYGSYGCPGRRVAGLKDCLRRRLITRQDDLPLAAEL